MSQKVGFGAHSNVYKDEGGRFVVKWALPDSIPGILKHYSYGKHSGTAYLTLEYAGGSLLSMLDMAVQGIGCFDCLNLAFTITSTLPILASIHMQGVIHGDIHPGNILVSSSGVKLINFGSSRFSRDSPNAPPPNYADTYGYSPYYSGVKCIAHGLPTFQDDVVSFAYTLVRVAHGGCMPWDNDFAEVMGSDPSPQLMAVQLIALKNSFSTQQLCKGLPNVFESFLTTALTFQKVRWRFFNYNYWREQFNITPYSKVHPPSKRYQFLKGLTE
ncbi:kinase-like protein [Pleurotus eryngii]|uniref:Kinase-like protein n=1 Tax=Pleurotus eryngii TaxID=5323 RepID=A0A9P5ZRF5_PLEER|nr:kinase-like protein [Pleurotus eryngii]